MKRQTILVLALVFTVAAAMAQDKKWTAQKANDWYAKQGWISGCNYQPNSAINQLEMFQKETFDKVAIDRELKWASDLGFTTMRVFLHHILWTTDKEGFKKRLNEYLAISSKHGIKTMFVFFDDCWNDTYAPGKQPEPKPGVHNSGWVRDPGTMIYTHPDTLVVLEKYVKDILTTFAKDDRILLWDLYNEPGNNQQHEKSLPLLKSVFAWARAVNPSQPLSAGVWNWGPKFAELNEFQLQNSDVITYHQYGYIEKHAALIDDLKKNGRPLICTEYMARRNGSLFQVIMPMLKEKNVGAINWGFISGKTNTIFAWDTPIPSGNEPELWFHDILRKDGTPYSPSEIQVIKAVNAKSKKK
ncbi:cellulase family glycosylhydrolase [Fulvivirgaceae bacterium PWU5]|uniref:Cellulase family glycosylhydrolase n=1 Tax=Dawidia cretensis TaxID=2782350 RepID=A0AAP2E0X5_9BACT|nr:cellulase family glycosylhydrolase [Dawidia cretensis]MBT1710971.1 cellulase family glycosylhydrolase [Dawidia cretensis]